MGKGGTIKTEGRKGGGFKCDFADTECAIRAHKSTQKQLNNNSLGSICKRFERRDTCLFFLPNESCVWLGFCPLQKSPNLAWYSIFSQRTFHCQRLWGFWDNDWVEFINGYFNRLLGGGGTMEGVAWLKAVSLWAYLLPWPLHVSSLLCALSTMVWASLPCSPQHGTLKPQAEISLPP